MFIEKIREGSVEKLAISVLEDVMVCSGVEFSNFAVKILVHARKVCIGINSENNFIAGVTCRSNGNSPNFVYPKWNCILGLAFETFA